MSSPTPQPQYYRRRRSLAGPIVLIILGVIFLLGNLHYLSWASLHHSFARYWPALLILWGVIKLIEHQQDTRAGLPSRGIGAGGVLLIIFLVLLGMSFTATDRINWNALRHDADFDGDFGGLFGNSYNYTATLEQPFAAGGELRVVSDRGDVIVNNWTDPKIKVMVRKRVVADNENEGKKIDSQTQPTFTSAGNVITLNANTGGAGNKAVASDLEIFLPAKAAMDISIRRGDVRIAGREGSVVASSHGDITIADNNGPVNVTMRRGNLRLSNIKGEVNVEGRIDDVNISDVSGLLRLTGDFFGQMNLAKLAKGVTFRSSRTDMALARLDGEMTMDSGDLRANALVGPMHLATRSKDIHLEDVSGALNLSNSNGTVEYQAGKNLGDVEINNRRGEVRVTVPRNAAFQVDARAQRGEIETDFPSIQVKSDHHAQYASGTVGSGGPQLRVVTDGGDVRIRQSSGAQAAPPSPTSPASPSAPKPPKPASTPGSERTSVIRQGKAVTYHGPVFCLRADDDYAPGTL